MNLPVNPVNAAPVQGAILTCFFDPSHGNVVTLVNWQPPQGVYRPIPVCPGCRQRLLGQAQQQPAPRHVAPRPEEGGSGIGDAVLGAAGGFAGGMLLGDLLDDDGHDDDSNDGDDDWF